jgi:hypothetical protein
MERRLNVEMRQLGIAPMKQHQQYIQLRKGVFAM